MKRRERRERERRDTKDQISPFWNTRKLRVGLTVTIFTSDNEEEEGERACINWRDYSPHSGTGEGGIGLMTFTNFFGKQYKMHVTK